MVVSIAVVAGPLLGVLTLGSLVYASIESR
jgi:hypothetical protein